MVTCAVLRLSQLSSIDEQKRIDPLTTCIGRHHGEGDFPDAGLTNSELSSGQIESSSHAGQAVDDELVPGDDGAGSSPLSFIGTLEGVRFVFYLRQFPIQICLLGCDSIP